MASASSSSRAPFAELNASAPQVGAFIKPAAGAGAGAGASGDASPAFDDTKLAELRRLLGGTLSASADTRQASTTELKAREKSAGFCGSLIAIIAAHSTSSKDLGTKLSAATYLKNLMTNVWKQTAAAADATESDSKTDSAAPTTGIMRPAERKQVRKALLAALFDARVSELRNMLAECFRIVVKADFPARWPTLVQSLVAQMARVEKNAEDKENSPWATENVAIAIHNLTKCYKFFLNPSVVNEKAPAELTDLCKRLLNPLQQRFFRPLCRSLVGDNTADAENAATAAPSTADSATTVKLLRVVGKAFFCATKSYMPGDGVDTASWLQDCLDFLSGTVQDAKTAIAAGATFEDPEEEDEELAADEGALWRVQKRCLKVMLSFQGRHRAQFKPFEAAIIKTVSQAVQLPIGALTDRVRALCFDLLARACEGATGWRLVRAELPSLLQKAVLPELALRSFDRSLWEMDEDEFVRRHMEDENSMATGFREDLIAARQSAMNFVGVVATREASSGNAPAADGADAAAGKKRSRKRGRGKKRGSARKSALLAFLNSATETLHNAAEGKASPSKKRRGAAGASGGIKASESMQYGVLMAFGAALPVLRSKPTMMANLFKDMLLPVFAADYKPAGYELSATPFVPAAALWVLSRAAANAPRTYVMQCFDSALELMGHEDAETDDGDEIVWKPVRCVAAVALRELVDHQFSRDMLKKHLAVLVDRLAAAAEEGDEESSISLLSMAVCKAEADIVPHAAKLTKALVQRCLQELEDGDQLTESQAVEALTTVAQTLEELVPDEDDEDDADGAAVDAAAVSAAVFAVHALLPELLAKWWQQQDADTKDDMPLTPEATCLLKFVLRFTKSSDNATGGAGAGAGAGSGAAFGNDTTQFEGAVWDVVSVFAARLPNWWAEVGEVEESWDVIMDVARRSSLSLKQRAIVFPAVASLGAGLVKNGCHDAVSAGCRMMLALFTSNAKTSEWCKDETLKAMAAAICDKFTEIDTGSAKQLERALVLCAAHCMSIDAVATTAAAEAAGVTSDLLKAHGRFACTLAGEGKDADEDETAGGPYAQLITGAMALAEAAWGGNGCEALDSSQGRRLLGEVLGGTIKQAMALAEEADEAEKAGSDADEEEEEDEDSEEEEEEEEDEGEEQGDEEDMAEGEDGESDDEESDMEEEDDDEFQARYADAAKALLEDNDDDVEPSAGYRELLPEDAEEAPLGAAATAFFSWFAANEANVSGFLKRGVASRLTKYIATRG